MTRQLDVSTACRIMQASKHTSNHHDHGTHQQVHIEVFKAVEEAEHLGPGGASCGGPQRATKHRRSLLARQRVGAERRATHRGPKRHVIGVL
jgi:hypothetical protein